MESRVGLGVVCWCVNWLTSRCPMLPGNRELVSSKSPTWKMKCEPEQEEHDKNVSLGVFLLNLILPTILRGLNSTGFLLSLPLKPRFPVCVCMHMCMQVSACVQPARSLSPQNSLGRNTGVDCHFLLQGIFPTQGSNPHLLRDCWSWSTNTLSTWWEELTPWKRPWSQERLKAGGERYMCPPPAMKISENISPFNFYSLLKWLYFLDWVSSIFIYFSSLILILFALPL